MNKHLPFDQGLKTFLYKQLLLFWPYYLSAVLCLVGTHYVQSFLPFFAKELADQVMIDASSIPTWKYFLLALGIIVFRTSSRLLFFYPARVMERDMRLELMQQVENTMPFRYKGYTAGQLYQIVSQDTEQMRAMVGFALLQLGNIVVALAVLTPKISSYHPQLLVALLPLVLCSFLFSFIVSRTQKYHRLAQDYQGDVQNFIMESYSGKPTIKNYHVENAFTSLFKRYSYKELLMSYKGGLGTSFAIPLIPLGVGVSLLWGAHIIKAQSLGANSLILFSGFTFLFLEPLAFLSWIGVVFASSIASWHRIAELVTALKVVSPEEQNLLSYNTKPTFQATEHWDLKVDFWGQDLGLPIYAGKWNVLIGSTGCGKSHAILQMAASLQQQGQNISYVAQSPYIYNDTLGGNIFLGIEATPEQQAYAYELLQLFGLDYLAADRESLLNMEVGEHGKRLSGGQAKRLCLVRSLMSGAPILIWDDPFSSIDVILEQQIIERLKGSSILKTGQGTEKTLIISSHRLSTVRKSDQVIYLEQKLGILEQGKARDLLTGTSKTNEYFQKQHI